jgi:hypothetical protein
MRKHHANIATEGGEMVVGIRVTRSAGMLLLGIWLILAGLGAMAPLPVPGVVTGVIALLAGILILIGR